MRIATVEEYIANSFLDAASLMDRSAALQDTIAPPGLNEAFPFHVVIEASYPELDVAVRWCWQSFGPKDGDCDWQTEYPACPIILAAEKTVRVSQSGYEYMEFVNPIKHQHTGSWTWYWFGKTDYDCGFGAFCFAHETEKIKFAEHVPHVDFGENYLGVKTSK